MDIKDNLASEFSAFSVNYTEDMIRCVPFYQSLLNCFVKHLDQDFVPNRILDLGCGNGNVTAKLIEEFPDAEYTLLDASDQMLKICENRFQGTNIMTIESYFQDYTFPSDYFDMVVAGFSIHHCEDNEKMDLMCKVHESLTRRGVFMCSDLMIDRDANAHKGLIKKWKEFVYSSFPDGEKWQWLMDHYNKFDHPSGISEQRAWLDRIGFTEVKFDTFENFWSFFIALKV